jgi:RHS repeat-associated protein
MGVKACSASIMHGGLFRHKVALFLWMLVLPLVCALISESAFANSPSSSPEMPPTRQFSLQGLDLSRTPTVDELTAAGQLGGPLEATHVIADRDREQAAHRDFGRAIEAWNLHQYRQAVALFHQHLEAFPDSPWASEAALHIGCDATYNGRYSEAETIFNQLIAENQGKQHAGARILLSKARQRLAILNIERNNLEEANGLLTALLLDSPDWRHRTYASHWIQRLSQFTAAQEALLNCGTEALGYAIDKFGHGEAAARVRASGPANPPGHSMAALVRLAGNHGFELVAVRITPGDLAQLPLPVILRIAPRNAGDRGHYWVLDKVQSGQVELFDPQSEHRFVQTFEELSREWNGQALVFSRGNQVPRQRLDLEIMENATGGCCGVPRKEADLGNPGDNGEEGSQSDGDSCGAPRWSVNMVNMNLYVTDTPLWYESPVGPPVHITLSYNSQSAIAYHEPFGNKWQFNYGSYLVVDTAGTVLVFMPDGRRDTYTPDGKGGYRQPFQVFNTLSKLTDNEFELRFPDDTVYHYSIPPGTRSQQPFLVEIRDAYGQKLSLGYDAQVRLITLTDAQGKVFRLSYNASGLVTEVGDPFGRTAHFAYDASQNLTSVTDMGGYSSSFTYDASVYLTSLGNERGTWTFLIEPADGIGNGSNPYPQPGTAMWQNYRITVTNPLGQTEEYHYNGYGSYSWHVSPRDYVSWTSPYESNLRSDVPKTIYSFTTVGPNRRGEIREIRSPGGGSIKYDYDSASGNRTGVTDHHGHVWRSTYNTKGQITAAIDPKNTPTLFAYTANGVDLLSISNGLGTIHMAYNDQHDLVLLTDRLTNTTVYSYSINGQILSQVDALGITNEFRYDASARLSEFLRAGLTLERYTYDSLGRIRTRTDATGLTLTNDYNGLNQVVRVTYPDGRFESYAYSTCCPRLLDSVTDRGGRTTFFVYNALKRLVQTVNPEGGVTRLEYDANGNLISLSDPSGNTTSFSYDLDNQLIRKTYANGKGLSFRYDLAGLLTARTNGRGIVTTYTYDANHNLLTTRHTGSTPGVTNTYDAHNRLVEIRDGVGTYLFAYDANSSLLSFDGPWAGDTITYAYSALGQRTNLIAQGSQPAGYDYDALNRLTRVRLGAQSHTYSYSGPSPLFNRLDRPNGTYTTYQYDHLNRLIGLSNRRSTGQVVQEFLYTYDAQDLRSSETVSNSLAIAFTNQKTAYDYSPLNQLLTSAPPSQVFAYDDDGNMTRGFTPTGRPFTASYDAEDRLSSLTFTNENRTVNRAEFVYAANGLLAATRHYENGVLILQTRYVSDGQFALQERGDSEIPVRTYTWGLHKGGGVAGLLSLKQDGQEYSYLYDGRDNVAALLNSSQAAVASYAYEPFGALLAKTGTLDQPYQFSTKPYDAVNGLVNYGYRFYSPSISRWLNRDPLGELGDPNLYQFLQGDPINNIDPDGLMKIPFLGWVPLGERAGQSALAYYARMLDDTSLPLWQRGGAWAGGALSALWLPCTSSRTLVVLSMGAGLRLPGIGKPIPTEPLHFGFDIPFTKLNIIHVGKYLPNAAKGLPSWHLGILPGGWEKTLLHLYRDHYFLQLGKIAKEGLYPWIIAP